jgi:hypothetical protein
LRASSAMRLTIADGLTRSVTASDARLGLTAMPAVTTDSAFVLC